MAVARAAVAAEKASRLEPLENGDRLRSREFLRRYEAMPELKKAELVEGVVFMGSPVRFNKHASPEALVHTWLGTYVASTPGTDHGANATVLFDPDNTLQPDAVLYLPQERGGRSRLNESDYLLGPPELVVEIAPSSVSIALHDKKRVYCRSGVREYLVWRTVEKKFDWFVLEGDDYISNTPDTNSVIRSRVFPGLHLNVAALLAMDRGKVLAILQKGLNSPGHRAFARAIKA